MSSLDLHYGGVLDILRAHADFRVAHIDGAKGQQKCGERDGYAQALHTRGCAQWCQSLNLPSGNPRLRESVQ
jgi:hypothetical protein